MGLKSSLKNLLPPSAMDAYYRLMARAAAVWYGNPSEHLFVIGVTGTNGKSSTVQFIGRTLENAGYRVGWTSTAGFKVGGREWTNEKKMTMLGRFQTQKLLKQMRDAGCTHVIVETSSQGVAQYRHVGINYDVAVFTNLTPEHIEAHGGFEPYKKAKGAFFAHVMAGKRKRGADGSPRPKVAVVNVDTDHAPYFLSFPADYRYGYGVAGKTLPANVLGAPFAPITAEALTVRADGSAFTVEGHAFAIKPIGLFNVYNVLAAIATCRAVGLAWEPLRRAVGKLEPVPGRLEFIEADQPFSVVVDYAYEPAALNACFDALAPVAHGRVIHVLGSAGGGRDVARRPLLGALSARRADISLVTNEDPYDDPPERIIDQVAAGALQAGKRDGVNLFRILDRQAAIDAAIAMAKPGDLVLITGKGCEPVMAVAGGKTVPWDDRDAVRRALRHKS